MPPPERGDRARRRRRSAGSRDIRRRRGVLVAIVAALVAVVAVAVEEASRPGSAGAHRAAARDAPRSTGIGDPATRPVNVYAADAVNAPLAPAVRGIPPRVYVPNSKSGS